MLHKLIKIILPLLYVMMIFSCKKETVQQDTGKGTTTSPGIPNELPVAEKTIGPAGGTLSSSDGLFTITLPSGALENDVQFSIQPITNTNPLGIHSGYRVIPHLDNLKQKATVRFTYTDAMLEGTAAAAIHAAYQNPQGIWMAVGGAQTDTTTHTVTVLTDHFSDWTLFSHFFLSPQNALVEPDNNLEMEVFLDTDFLEPLTEDSEYPVGGKTNSAGQYVKSWSLFGEGQLQHQKENATYKAPSDPSTDEATVVAELDLGDGGQYLLISHIRMEYSGIKLIKDGGPEKFIKAYAWKLGSNWVIAGGNDDATDKIQLSWEGGTGHHAFDASTNNTFLYMPTTDEIFVSYHTPKEQAVPSSGGITITSMDAVDDYIEGNFDVFPTGKLEGNFAPASGDASGTFRVKKKEVPTTN